MTLDLTLTLLKERPQPNRVCKLERTIEKSLRERDILIHFTIFQSEDTKLAGHMSCFHTLKVNCGF